MADRADQTVLFTGSSSGMGLAEDLELPAVAPIGKRLLRAGDG